ncbi:MAG: hypothetical protein U0531_16350 [Dehalococcoidia bacterium]
MTDTFLALEGGDLRAGAPSRFAVVAKDAAAPVAGYAGTVVVRTSDANAEVAPAAPRSNGGRSGGCTLGAGGGRTEVDLTFAAGARSRWKRSTPTRLTGG